MGTATRRVGATTRGRRTATRANDARMGRRITSGKRTPVERSRATPSRDGAGVEGRTTMRGGEGTAMKRKSPEMGTGNGTTGEGMAIDGGGSATTGETSVGCRRHYQIGWFL